MKIGHYLAISGVIKWNNFLLLLTGCDIRIKMTCNVLLWVFSIYLEKSHLYSLNITNHVQFLSRYSYSCTHGIIYQPLTYRSC